MRWNDNGIDKPKVFDSRDLSEDTQKIRLDKIQERLKEEDYNEEFREYEKKLAEHRGRLKIIFISIGAAVISMLIFISISSMLRISKVNNLKSDAEEYLKENNFTKAADTYKELYEETEDPIYMQNYRNIMKDIENNDLIREANNSIKDKDYEGAIELLLTITTDDDILAENINDKINYAAKKWLSEIEEMYSKGEYSRCNLEINKFVNLLPDNIGGVDFRNKFSKKNSRNSTKLKSGLAKDRKTLDILNSKVRVKMYEKSKSIVGTEQFIAVDSANVREKPNKEAKIKGTVHKGESIYVEDTFVEGGKNIWCKINYYSKNRKYNSGWISYNIINGIEDIGN